MPVHLTVAHKSDATLKGEATYHEETITIGRDRTNVLHLSDESKTHFGAGAHFFSESARHRP
ncbi:MAG TPA: hypothetical protein PKV71_20770, partial [Calditrichia bacterium]|nr:hypothetical protein [Calditrichia bacterium]